MISAPFIAVLCTYAQATVTLDLLPTNLADVVEQISQQSGVRLAAGDQGDRVVLVSVKNMPLETLLKEIEAVTDSSWESAGGVRTLVRSAARKAAAAKAADELRGELLRAGIEPYLQVNKDQIDWSEDKIRERIERVKKLAASRPAGTRIRVYGAGDATPEIILLREALQKLPNRVLGSIRPGHRIVFSDANNLLQSQLPYKSSATASYIAAYNTLARLNVGAVDGGGGSTILTPLTQERKPIDSLGKQIVAVHNLGHSVEFEVATADTAGQILGRASCRIAPHQPADAEVPAGLQGSIELTGDSKTLLNATKSTLQALTVHFQVDTGTSVGRLIVYGATALPRSALERLLDPLVHEPLASFVGETFRSLATMRKKDLVALLPDSTFTGIASLGWNPRLDVRELYKRAPRAGIRIEEGDTLRIKPDHIADHEFDRVSRADLRELISTCRTDQAARLSHLAKYASGVAHWGVRRMDHAILALVAPDAAGAFAQAEWPLLQAIAALESGVSAERTSWSPDRLTHTQLRVVTNALLLSGSRQRSNLAESEPTEGLSSGLPRSAEVSIKRSEESGFLALRESPIGRIISLGDIALTQALRAAALPSGIVLDQELGKLLDARVGIVTLELKAGPYSTQADFRDAHATSREARSLGSLPNHVSESIQRLRKQFEELDVEGLWRTTWVPPAPAQEGRMRPART